MSSMAGGLSGSKPPIFRILHIYVLFRILQYMAMRMFVVGGRDKGAQM